MATKKQRYNLGKVAATVKRLRMEKDLTRDDLAREAKVNYNTIIKLESGANKNPTAKTLIGLSAVFGCTIDDLLS
jgi:transcriptional regulator with XRE-family HTH domain